MTTPIQIYPLFVALTRTPMLMGVTQTFFVLNVLLCMVLFLLSKNIILSTGLLMLCHVIGIFICRHDERFFEILFGKLALHCPNRFLWKCNSYDPN